eukprot:TRINITY_DN3384_c0_g1_i12.p1 TRINITY_DN3384_c0_g1~~TRINITY_DN3384_c0_g1_i12.p1  ORF type:complete len:293 (-),score=55.69 TRINITY_DN3384_c0_g1_i12:134-1012(-)
MVFAIVGITGNVGSSAANNLLKDGKKVRAIVRDEAKGEEWKKKGAEIAIADLHDADSLAKAFTGVEGAYIMTPPLLHSDDIYGENEKIVHALVKAVVTSKVPKVVLLSGIGAHLPSGTGAILKLHVLENEFFKLPGVSVASLRATWFYENVLGNLKPAQETGNFYSFKQSVDERIPQVATKDIGKLAAEVLEQPWEGHRIIDVHGPRDYSFNDIGKAFSTVLGKPINVNIIPPEKFVETYKSFGFSDSAAKSLAELHEGGNSGHTVFGGDKKTEEWHGTTTFEDLLREKLGK